MEGEGVGNGGVGSVECEEVNDQCVEEGKAADRKESLTEAGRKRTADRREARKGK